jgi:hypothetical protein
MRYSLAQWTGMAVTAIVVLGSDMDILYAVPLGLFAGALGTFFSALAEQQLNLAPPVQSRSRPRPAPRLRLF